MAFFKFHFENLNRSGKYVLFSMQLMKFMPLTFIMAVCPTSVWFQLFEFHKKMIQKQTVKYNPKQKLSIVSLRTVTESNCYLYSLLGIIGCLGILTLKNKSKFGTSHLFLNS